MSVNHAWMLKGWLLGETNVPEEIMDAIDTVIASMNDVEPRIKIDSVTSWTPDGIARMSRNGIGDSESAESEVAPAACEPLKSEKKKRNWSPEQKAAAGERLRARIAAGKMKRQSSPGEAQAPSTGGA